MNGCRIAFTRIPSRINRNCFTMYLWTRPGSVNHRGVSRQAW